MHVALAFGVDASLTAQPCLSVAVRWAVGGNANIFDLLSIGAFGRRHVHESKPLSFHNPPQPQGVQT